MKEQAHEIGCELRPRGGREFSIIEALTYLFKFFTTTNFLPLFHTSWDQGNSRFESDFPFKCERVSYTISVSTNQNHCVNLIGK